MDYRCKPFWRERHGSTKLQEYTGYTVILKSASGLPMIRVVKPEILDSLPENHPDALRNRRDIRLFNQIMGNFQWFFRQLSDLLLAGDTILEIGAGAGDLGIYLRDKCLTDAQIRIDGLDLCSRPIKWPENWAWHQCDLREFNDYGHYSVILVNFVLHQFEGEDLRALGCSLSTAARLILASETARSRLHLHQLWAARLLGINYVSRHDAKVSIEGGFRDDELPHLLKLEEGLWNFNCTQGFFGQYRMIAQRK